MQILKSVANIQMMSNKSDFSCINHFCLGYIIGCVQKTFIMFFNKHPNLQPVLLLQIVVWSKYVSRYSTTTRLQALGWASSQVKCLCGRSSLLWFVSVCLCVCFSVYLSVGVFLSSMWFVWLFLCLLVWMFFFINLFVCGCV